MLPFFVDSGEYDGTSQPSPSFWMSSINLTAALDEAEDLYLTGHAAAALSAVLPLLPQLSGHPAESGGRDVATLHLPPSGLHDHYCHDECICQAAVCLAIQCLHDIGQVADLDPLMAKCFPILRLCPFPVFTCWFACVCDRGEYTLATNRLRDYWRDEPSALLPCPLTSAQRATLLQRALALAWVPAGQLSTARAAIDAARLHGWIDAAQQQVQCLPTSMTHRWPGFVCVFHVSGCLAGVFFCFFFNCVPAADECRGRALRAERAVGRAWPCIVAHRHPRRTR